MSIITPALARDSLFNSSGILKSTSVFILYKLSIFTEKASYFLRGYKKALSLEVGNFVLALDTE